MSATLPEIIAVYEGVGVAITVGVGAGVIDGDGVAAADTTRLTAVTCRGAPLVFISSVQPAVNVSPPDACILS